MTKRMRMGMIGCGEIAVRTASGIAGSSRVEHVMVADRDERMAADLGVAYGVPSTSEPAELLANPDVDAVYIAVPHHLHAPLTIQALQAGKHVIVEKPIATAPEDADAMIEAAATARRALAVAYMAPFDERLREVRRLLAEGAIGTVTGTRVVARIDKPESYWGGGWTGRVRADWRTRWTTSGGGVLVMNASHDLNTMRYVTGLEVAEVYAAFDTYVTPVEVEDYIALTYRYENGAIGSLEAGSAVRGGDPLHEVDRVYGERGQVLLGHDEVRVYTTETGEWRPVGGRAPDSDTERAALVDALATAVERSTPPPVTGEDGRAILRVVDAAYRSGRTRQPVSLA